MRDDFPDRIKQLLSHRVGHRCSNPRCRRDTSAAALSADKWVNIGVAAHITAASPGGPRFDVNLAKEMRVSSGNGIWLCQSCAKLVDNDVHRFPAHVLQQWKIDSEVEAHERLIAVQSPETATTRNDGLEILYFSLHRLNPHWREGADSVPRLPFEFDFPVRRHFYLETFASNFQPSFDVVCVNNSDSPAVILKIGILLHQTSHVRYEYGMPITVRLAQGSSYIVPIPDVWKRLGVARGVELMPSKMDLLADVDIEEIVYLGPGSPFRCSIILGDYVANVPNHSIVSLFLSSNIGDAYSEPFHLFTL